MSDEHWATFSIYDHRTAIFRQALLLFDRIVVPVPAAPFRKLTLEELDALNADVDYLRANDAAVPFEWDPERFHRWQASVAGEALASTLNRDPLYATRLQLAREALPLKPAGVDSVVAVPVYGSEAEFGDSTEELREDGLQDTVLLEVVLPRLPVPAPRTSLETIIDLRNRESFREAIFNLRKWQAKVLPDLLKDPGNRDRHLRAAAADFDRWIRQYTEAVADANFAKGQDRGAIRIGCGRRVDSADQASGCRPLRSCVTPLLFA